MSKVIRQNRIVGDWDEDTRTFTKHVTKSKHFMRVVSGYGMEEDVFRKLITRAAYVVIIEDKKNRLVSSISDWIAHGKTMNYGSGSQRFLSVKYMKDV